MEKDKYYELLGVKPGVSPAELKAAHRDLAKVWHPDRFGHDERLQKKAQEKLKEINEAYEVLISGKVPRSARPTSHHEPQATSSERRDYGQGNTSHSSSKPERSRIPAQWIVVPLLIFGFVFFAVSRYRLRQEVNPESTAPQVHQEQETVNASSRADASETTGKHKNRNDTAPRNEVSQVPASETNTTKLQPMQTTTVLIDPSTGLLAKTDCPVKTRMTYPVGNEPHGYCTATHTTKSSAQVDNDQTKDSTVKSLAKRVVSPKKWLGSGSKESEGDRQ